MHDRHGHEIDPTVGYARGSVLSSSTEELRRYLHAQTLIRARLESAGPDSIQVFTGNMRDFPLRTTDLGRAVEEWQGSALFLDQLHDRVVEHLGGRPEHAVAAFNRTSAAIVAALSVLGQEGIVSFAPEQGGAHPSVRRGAAVAGARLVQAATAAAVEAALAGGPAGVLVVTPVNSDLRCLGNDELLRAVEVARRHGVPVLVDDAYGARVRPILLDGPLSLQLGADLAVTNADKAGLPGPRAGVMAGDPTLLRRVQGRAAEWGMEARAPIALAVLRSLEAYSPDDVRDEVIAGEEMYAALCERFGTDRVSASPLGPVMAEDDVWAMVTDLSGGAQVLVPAEVTAAIGQVLLQRGILTVNACGQPGSRVSIRFKAQRAELERAGGAVALARHLADAMTVVAGVVGDLDASRRLIVGE